jgi:hypothetical protein
MSELTESQVSSENNPAGGFVETTLNYFAEASEKPVIYTYEAAPGVPRTTRKSEAHSVLIRNARAAEELSLDRQGFQLVHQETAVRDFYDRVEVEKVYYPEIEALLKEATGAEKIVVFDHQVRNIELSKQGEKDAREYVRTVHNDWDHFALFPGDCRNSQTRSRSGVNSNSRATLLVVSKPSKHVR